MLRIRNSAASDQVVRKRGPVDVSPGTAPKVLVVDQKIANGGLSGDSSLSLALPQERRTTQVRQTCEKRLETCVSRAKKKSPEVAHVSCALLLGRRGVEAVFYMANPRSPGCTCGVGFVGDAGTRFSAQPDASITGARILAGCRVVLCRFFPLCITAKTL